MAASKLGKSAEGRVPIREVRVRNFLSLKDVTVRLDQLNVLVGPNGGGKSNFLAVFRFLGEVARTDLAPALQSLFGGFEQVKYRGITRGPAQVSVRVVGEITDYSSPRALDEYELTFRKPIGRDRFLWRREVLVLKRTAGRGRRITLVGTKLETETEVSVRGPGRAAQSSSRESSVSTVESSASALSVLRRIGEINDTKQIGQLAEVFEDLRLFDPQVSLARQPSFADDMPKLSPDARNLASVLSFWHKQTPDIVSAIEDDLRDILPGFRKFNFRSTGGGAETVWVDVVERGLSGSTPMARASFGTVRMIALLAMLRDPNPPRLTCVEEIDHGLHPHALDIVTERLREASARSQIIVVTHSPALVNRLDPKELIVFERDASDSSTRIIQKDPETIQKMQEASGLGLGELWFSGSLGGVPQ